MPDLSVHLATPAAQQLPLGRGEKHPGLGLEGSPEKTNTKNRAMLRGEASSYRHCRVSLWVWVSE